MIAALVRTLRTWFSNTQSEKCLQCGLPPGRQFMIATDEPIMHPHQCSVTALLYARAHCLQAVLDRRVQRPAA